MKGQVAQYYMQNAITKDMELTKEEIDEPPGCKLIETSKPDSPGMVNFRPESIPDTLWNNWKWQFRNRITSIETLKDYLHINDNELARLNLVTLKYPAAITPYYLSLIDPDDVNDPIRKQAVPCFEEIALSDMGMEDPLGEKKDSAVPGLVHRYPDRVLMVLTNLCPMLCRHCTRKREWKHGVWVRTSEQIEAMLDYVRNHREVRDVILSGGDPLSLSTNNLEKVILELRRINHVEIIRIGSRYPVVLPQRIDEELCSMLSEYGPIWLNTHFNHYREITPESAAACDKLVRSGVPVNNQSVLLKGINDTVEIQKKLCQGLLRIKVRPYYLYQCDEVQGTEHLRTPVDTGLKIIEGLRGHTSGLAVPAFVIDLPDGGGKVPLQPDYMLKKNKESLLLRNYEGNLFRYRNPRLTGAKRHPIKTEVSLLKAANEKEKVPVRVIKRKEVMDENRTVI
jgi:lysine 2,3-aminomutase